MDVRTNGLNSPTWWGALVVLLVNDHVLKHADVLPGLLTGKLSDFAGLIVAPVLLAAFVESSRDPKRRAIAFALVLAPFVAINVSTNAAAGTEELLALVGVKWRIWTDPTDLIALAILPWAWRLCDAPMRTRTFTRMAIALGAFACMATSWPQPTTQALLVNHTLSEQTVRVRFLNADMDCDAIEARVADALSRDLFGDGTTYTLAVNRVLPLSAAGFDPPCDAVLLHVDGMPETIAFWSDINAEEFDAFLTPDLNLPRGAIQLLPADEGVTLETEDVTLVETREHLPNTCTHGSAYQWTALPESDLEWQVDAKTRTADGCFRLELSGEVGARTLFMCLPEWALPFEAEDLVTVIATPTSLHVQGDTEELRVVQLIENARYWGRRASVVASECAARTECGAYVMPAELRYGDAIVRQDMPLELVDGNRRITVGVGRAENVIAGAPGCDSSRRMAGQYAEMVMLRETNE